MQRQQTHNASFMYANENLLVFSANAFSSSSGNLSSLLYASLSCQYTAYARRSALLGFGNELIPISFVPMRVMEALELERRHTTCGRIGTAC